MYTITGRRKATKRFNASTACDADGTRSLSIAMNAVTMVSERGGSDSSSTCCFIGWATGGGGATAGTATGTGGGGIGNAGVRTGAVTGTAGTAAGNGAGILLSGVCFDNIDAEEAGSAKQGMEHLVTNKRLQFSNAMQLFLS